MIMKTTTLIMGWIFSFCFAINTLQADIAFATDPQNETIYAFDPNNLSIPATPIITGLITPDNITISPNGMTAYFTSVVLGDVYSFPVMGPYTPTLVVSGLSMPVGIAISSDSLTGFALSDTPFPGAIYSFPTSGGVATPLVPIGPIIDLPLFMVISDNTAFVASYITGSIYTFPITSSSTTYNATLIQSTAGVGGLAISDGYLYWSTAYNTLMGQSVYRVPLASPTATPTLVGTTANPGVGVDGLAISCDGNTVFLAQIDSPGAGINTIPTNQGLPQPQTLAASLNIPAAFDVAIACPSAPPTNLTAKRKKNDFGLVFECFNRLHWDPSPATNIAYYEIYRNGVPIASVNSRVCSYEDHNQCCCGAILYSVVAVTTSGSLSAPVNVSLQ
jgi:hypothetical protein